MPSISLLSNHIIYFSSGKSLNVEVISSFTEYDQIDMTLYYFFCLVLQDRQTKANRGVAFVQFSNRNEANNGNIFKF